MLKILLLLICGITYLYSYEQPITKIESVQSLYIEIYRDNIRLGSATGFVICSKTKNYLVTNYHVVAIKNRQTILG